MKNYRSKPSNFVPPEERAKSAVVARVVRIAQKEKLDYDAFLYVCEQALRKLGLRKPKRERRLPQLLSEGDRKRFFQVIQECGNVQHETREKPEPPGRMANFTFVRDWAKTANIDTSADFELQRR